MRGIAGQVATLVWKVVTVANRSVNATYWNGTAVASPDTAGYPKVTIKSGTGTGELSLSSGAVTVGTNNDKTGYTASTVSDKTGYALAAGASGWSAIKSIQYGTYTFAGGATTATATISSVTTGKTALIFLGFAIEKGATTGVFNLPYITLTNATTVTATRIVGTDSGSSNVAGTGSFVAVEFY